jgi:hypothetical protein
MLFLFNSVIAQNSDWIKEETFTDSQTVSKLNLLPQKVHFFELNVPAFTQRFVNVPLRGNAFGTSTIVKVPGIDGKLESFKMYEASVFAPELAARFPNIKSYVGFSEENKGAELRMSISHKGIQTMISYVDKPTVFMQPTGDDVSKYVLY